MEQQLTIKNIIDTLDFLRIHYDIIGMREFLLVRNRKQYSLLGEHLPVLFMEYAMFYVHAPTNDFDILWQAMNSVNLRFNRVKIILDEDEITFRLSEKIMSQEALLSFFDDSIREITEAIEDFKICCKQLMGDKYPDMDQLMKRIMYPEEGTFNGKGPVS